MAKLYKISKETANNIGFISYGENQMFNPFCLEQNDGSYIVNGDLVDELNNLNIITISASKLTEISENEATINAKNYGLYDL